MAGGLMTGGLMTGGLVAADGPYPALRALTVCEGNGGCLES